MVKAQMVSICTPHPSHADLVDARRGVHALVEKLAPDWMARSRNRRMQAAQKSALQSASPFVGRSRRIRHRLGYREPLWRHHVKAGAWGYYDPMAGGEHGNEGRYMKPAPTSRSSRVPTDR
jgi:hypothetical protein